MDHKELRALMDAEAAGKKLQSKKKTVLTGDSSYDWRDMNGISIVECNLTAFEFRIKPEEDKPAVLYANQYDDVHGEPRWGQLWANPEICKTMAGEGRPGMVGVKRIAVKFVEAKDE